MWMATLVDDVVAAFEEIARAVEDVVEDAAAAADVEAAAAAAADAEAACDVCLVACCERAGACCRKELKKEERKNGRCDGIVLVFPFSLLDDVQFVVVE